MTRLAVVTTLLLAGCAAPPRTLDSTVSALMEEHRVPGVALAILEGGAVASVRGFGFEDAARTRPVEPSTVFQAASLGKPLFAYAAIASGVEIDAPIPGVDPARTPAQVFSHTAGPDPAWRYSGEGFTRLQRALERTSGVSLDALVAREIAGPAGMSRTTYAPDAGGPPNAAFTLRTTAQDYARFVERMYADLAAGPGSVGARMLVPRATVDETLGLEWGLGWGLARADGERFFLHWGSNPGFKSLVLASIDRRKAIVVLTRGDGGLELATDLVPAVFGRDYRFLRFRMMHPDD